MNIRKTTRRSNPSRHRKLLFEGLETRWVLNGEWWHDSTNPVADPANCPAAGGASEPLETIVLSPAYLDAVTGLLAEGEDNSPPVAYDSSESVGHNDTIDTNLNAEDDDGDDLTYSLVNGPQHGTVTLTAVGDFLYDPENSYLGTDEFTYSVSDGQASATATVTIQVVNGRPRAFSDNRMGTTNSSNFGTVTGIDDDGDPITFSLHSGPAHGTVTIEPNGQYRYDPEPDYAGVDSFQFVATDSLGAVSDPATLSIALQVPPGVSVVHVRDAIEGIQTGQFKFTRPLSALPMTVYFRFAPTSTATLDDPATPPGDGDFTSTHVPYSVTFAANEQVILATITAYDDDIPDNEFVVVQILNYAAPGQGPVQYMIGYNNAQVYLKDPPVVSAVGTSVAEGDTGATTAQVNISLSYAIPVDTTVNFLTADGSATTADNDYSAIGSGSVLIPAGQTTPTSPALVEITGDDKHEPHEDFELQITSTSVAAVNIDPNAATIFINNDDYVPVITSPGAQTDREGTTVSKQITVTDGDTPASGLTLTVSGLPTGLTMSSSGLISGKIPFTAAGNFTVTVTATDTGGNQGTMTFSWTVTDVLIDWLTGTEYHASAATSNLRTVTGLTFDDLYVSPGNVVRLTVGNSNHLPPDLADVLFAISGGDSGNFSSTPVVTPNTGASTVVLVGIDLDDDGTLDTAERTHSLTLHTIDFSGATVGAQRTSTPVETTHYTIVSNEHFEVGGTFEFELAGGTGSVTGTPSLIRAELWKADSQAGDPVELLASASGLSLATNLTQASKTFVRFYADANSNGQFNSGEAYLKSADFWVLNRKIYDIAVDVSSKFVPALTQTTDIAPLFLNAENLLLRKDSESDFRSAVEFRTTTTTFIATLAGGARPDPVLNDFDEQNKHYSAAADIVFVETLVQTGTLGLTAHQSWHEILIEWDPGHLDRLAVVVAHEFGHGVGLVHSAGDGVDDPPRIMSAQVAGTGYNELSEEEADAYD